MLLALVRRMPDPPTRLAFVDDQVWHVETVARAAREAKLDIDAVWFTGDISDVEMAEQIQHYETLVQTFLRD